MKKDSTPLLPVEDEKKRKPIVVAPSVSTLNFIKAFSRTCCIEKRVPVLLGKYSVN